MTPTDRLSPALAWPMAGGRRLALRALSDRLRHEHMCSGVAIDARRGQGKPTPYTPLTAKPFSAHAPTNFLFSPPKALKNFYPPKTQGN
jgi:hypothetical protein